MYCVSVNCRARKSRSSFSYRSIASGEKRQLLFGGRLAARALMASQSNPAGLWENASYGDCRPLIRFARRMDTVLLAGPSSRVLENGNRCSISTSSENSRAMEICSPVNTHRLSSGSVGFNSSHSRRRSRLSYVSDCLCSARSFRRSSLASWLSFWVRSRSRCPCADRGSSRASSMTICAGEPNRRIRSLTTWRS